MFKILDDLLISAATLSIIVFFVAVIAAFSVMIAVLLHGIVYYFIGFC